MNQNQKRKKLLISNSLTWRSKETMMEMSKTYQLLALIVEVHLTKIKLMIAILKKLKSKRSLLSKKQKWKRKLNGSKA